MLHESCLPQYNVELNGSPLVILTIKNGFGLIDVQSAQSVTVKFTCLKWVVPET